MVNSVEILIRAIDQASATFDSIGKKGVGMSHDLESACVKVGAALTGIGISAKLMADDVNKAFLGFEKGLTELKGLGVVGDDLDLLKQKALDLSKTMPLGLDEITAAMYNMVSVGYSAEEVYNTIGSSATLAVAGSAELDVVTEALTNSLKIFESQGLTAAEATAIMAKAVGDGKFELDDLLQEMMMSIGVASNLGMSFQELAGYNVAIQSAFTDASTAGTALRGVMMNLTEEKTIKLMKEMGIAVADNSGEFRGMIPIMKDLNRYFERHAGTVDKNTKLGELFGQRSINAALALMREASAAGTAGSALDDIVAAMGDATFIQDQYNAKMEDTGNKLEIANNKMNAAKVALGEAMVPYTLMAADAMSTFAGIIEHLPDPLQGLIGAFLTFGQALIPLGPLIMALPTIMGAVGPAATLLGGAMTGLSGVLSGSLTVGATGAAGGIAGLGITLGTLIPVIGAVVAAVAVFYLAWTNNWGGIQEKVRYVIDFIQDRINGLKRAFEPVMEALGAAGKRLGDAFGRIYEKADTLFKKITGGVSISQALGKAMEVLGKIIDAVFTTLGRYVVGVIDGVAGAFEWLIDRVGDLIDWFNELMSNPVVAWMVEKFGGAISWIGDKLNLTSDALDAYNGSVNTAAKTTGDAAESMKSFWESTDAAGKALKSTGDTGSETVSAIGRITASLDGGTASVEYYENALVEMGYSAEEAGAMAVEAAKATDEAWKTSPTKELRFVIVDENGNTIGNVSEYLAGRISQGLPIFEENEGLISSGRAWEAEAARKAKGIPQVAKEERIVVGQNTAGVDIEADYVVYNAQGSPTMALDVTNAGYNTYQNTGRYGWQMVEASEGAPEAGWNAFEYWNAPWVTASGKTPESEHYIPPPKWGPGSENWEDTAKTAADATEEIGEAVEETSSIIDSSAGQIESSAATIGSANAAIASSHAETAVQSVSAADQMRAAMLEKMAAMRGGATAESGTMATEVSGAASRMRISSAAEAANMADIVKAKFAEMSASAQGISTGSGAGSSGGGEYSSEMCPFGETGIPTGRGAGQVNSVGNGVITTQGYVSATGNTGFRSKAYQQAQGLLPCAAKGGAVTDEGIVLVGEQGPELIRLPRGAKVSSTSQTQRAARQKDTAAKNEIHLHIGTFVGDQAGLRKLQRLLEGMSINENVRKGVTG